MLHPVVMVQEYLDKKIAPWIKDGLMARLAILAAGEEPVVPEGVCFSSCNLPGPRQPVRKGRVGGDVRQAIATWPQAALIEKRVPFIIGVLKGATDFQAGRYLLHCKEGEFIFLPSGIPHPDGSRPHLHGENRREGICDLFWIVPWTRGLRLWICRSEGEDHLHLTARESNLFVVDARAAQLFWLLCTEIEAGKDRVPVICDDLMRLVVTSLQLRIRQGHAFQAFMPHDEVPAVTGQDPIRQVQELFKANLDKRLTLDQAANSVFMSRARFASQFRQQTGQTFVTWCNEQRLEHARTLLRETEIPVTVICRLTGFKSPAYFHHLFRREQECTPHEYRGRTCGTGFQED